MSSRSWALKHKDLGGVVWVRGFADPDRARDHVRRHWLNCGESWGRLCTGLLPSVARRCLDVLETKRSGGDPTAAVEIDRLLARAVASYESAIARGTARPTRLAFARRLCHRDGMGPLQHRYAVVSPAGFFATWARGKKPSELRTALRPLVSGAARPPSDEDYLCGALDYATRQVAVYGTWKPSRASRGRPRGC